MKVWDRAWIELKTPGSAVRPASVARHVTDCAIGPSTLGLGQNFCPKYQVIESPVVRFSVSAWHNTATLTSLVSYMSWASMRLNISSSSLPALCIPSSNRHCLHFLNRGPEALASGSSWPWFSSSTPIGSSTTSWWWTTTFNLLLLNYGLLHLLKISNEPWYAISNNVVFWQV